MTQIHTDVSASLTDIASTGLAVPPMIEDLLRRIHTTTGSAMAAVYADRRLRAHTGGPPSFGSQDTRPPPDAPPAPRGRGRRRARPLGVLVIDQDDIPAEDIPAPAEDIPAPADDIPAGHFTPTPHASTSTHIIGDVGTSSSVPFRIETIAQADALIIESQGPALPPDPAPHAPARRIYRRVGRRGAPARGRGDAVDVGAPEVTHTSLAAGRERRATAGQRRGCGT